MIKNTFSKKVSIIPIFLFVFIILFSGCTPIEDTIVKDQHTDNATMQPLTAIEWTNKVDRILLPLLNDGETFLSNHLDIVKGKFPTNEEIVMVDSSLNKVQTAIEEINALYQPKEYTYHKSDVITRLKAYKDALQNYRAALEKGDMGSIKLAADKLKDELSALKTVFEVYQR